MGYTEFTGQMSVTPPLNAHEITYLTAFSESRHMQRHSGDYTVGQDQSMSPDVIADKPPHGQPGYWCDWVPTADGAAIEWNRSEKFYYATEWLRYLIDHFLTGRAGTFATDPQATGFTFNHVCDGKVLANGGGDDVWEITIAGNQVTTRHCFYPGVNPEGPR